MSRHAARAVLFAAALAGAALCAGGLVTAQPALAAGSNAAATTTSTSSTASTGLSRFDRDLLLVGLTFILGVPLLGAPEVARRRRPVPGDPSRASISDAAAADSAPEPEPAPRPRITLYDDPALLTPEAVRSVRDGRPPPLR